MASLMEHQRRRSLAVQGGRDRVKMLGALGQHQHLATLRKGILDFRRDGSRPFVVSREVTKHVLDAGFRR